MSFTKAERKAVPLMIGVAGTSGSGKTYSALLMAAGIAGEGGKVGMIDTEAGRGSMYADDPDIIAAMPNGEYYVQELTEPFSPAKYQAAIKEAADSGISVLVIDSATHEWEGFGGCQDIAEKNKLRGMPNWAMAKMQHKRLMNQVTQCPMHIIFCLRAREKTRPVKDDNGKIEMVQEGMQAIQEKNFMYEMTLSMLLEDCAPGRPIITKCPKPLVHLFQGEQALISKDVGDKLRAWADGGAEINTKLRDLKRECRQVAMEGSRALDEYFLNMNKDDKSLLGKLTDEAFQKDMRSLAEDADALAGDDLAFLDEQPEKLFNDS